MKGSDEGHPLLSDDDITKQIMQIDETTKEEDEAKEIEDVPSCLIDVYCGTRGKMSAYLLHCSCRNVCKV